MGISVNLQNETGKIIESIVDDQNLTFKLIPPLTDKESVLLRFVDPYGDTVFNTLQASDLKYEIESRLSAVTDREVQEFWQKILKLVNVLNNKSHLYLEFVGD